MLKTFYFYLLFFSQFHYLKIPFLQKITLTKYSDVTIKMDGIVYNLVLNIEIFVIFEVTSLKFLLKIKMK